VGGPIHQPWREGKEGKVTGLCRRPATYKVSQLSKSRFSLSVDMTPYLTSYRIS
jgi:hypothetical protein